MNIQSYQSKNYNDFIEIVDQLKDELGSRFPISIQNWCGIGERPYPLKTWEIFLAKDDLNEVVGFYSYYQQENDPPHKFWIGWIGVKNNFRRMGIASKFINLIEQTVIKLGAKELWVYTDANNVGAVMFYRSRNMIDFGTFIDVMAKQAAAKDDSAVLMKDLQINSE